MNQPSDRLKLALLRQKRLIAALPLLCEGHDDARAHGLAHCLDPWQFALSARELTDAGLTLNDLRWLLTEGHVVHAEERTSVDDRQRVFHPIHSLAITPATCLLLTPEGVSFCNTLFPNATDELIPDSPRPATSAGAIVPRWDGSHRVLTWNAFLIKRFRQPAPLQEIILQSFEEEGWPQQIDDPLPGVHEINPKERLHDTIKRLNRGHLHQALLFRGNGTGCGICWEAAPERP